MAANFACGNKWAATWSGAESKGARVALCARLSAVQAGSGNRRQSRLDFSGRWRVRLRRLQLGTGTPVCHPAGWPWALPFALRNQRLLGICPSSLAGRMEREPALARAAGKQAAVGVSPACPVLHADSVLTPAWPGRVPILHLLHKTLVRVDLQAGDG